MGIPREKLVVKVSKTDIKKGSPNCIYGCAISRGVARAIHSSVSNHNIETAEGGVLINQTSYFPATRKDRIKMENFIENFDCDDSRKYCRPTTIRLKKHKNT